MIRRRSLEHKARKMTFADIRADFELLDDWEDRYRYLIELGRNLPPLEPNLKTDANKVRGCTKSGLACDERQARQGPTCASLRR